MTADPRARWAESLRTAPDATVEVAAAAFLRLLPGDEFSPPTERVAAANALASTLAPVGRDEAVEELHRAEADAFAARFWSLAPAERLLVWSDLSRRGAAPGRLRELEPGLDVVAPALSDPAAEELAALVRELFVLAPRPRAIRRNAWLLEHAAEADTWRAAHATLQKEAPALAALEPRLQRVLELGFRAALVAFVEGATAPAPSDATVRQSVSESIARFKAARQQERESQPAYESDYEAADRARAKRIMQGGVLAVALMAVGCCALSVLGKRATGESATPRAATPAPTSAPRTSASPESDPPRDPLPATIRSFTVAEVAEFERYERDLAAGIKSQQPLAYAGWRLAGRPRGVDAAGEPTPTRPLVQFDRDAIRACEDYDRKRAGEQPPLYPLWVAAGKPTFPGSYPLRSDVPPPR